ncbi:MAG: two pore domain potassium channel family protein [Kangiellaceae bacterium]|nr:two pore domain potassium channel family protein [Kangiellaceae bacterium]
MWFIFFVSMVLISLCVVIHYEALYRMTKIMRWLQLPPRFKVAFGVLWSLLAHTIEIWLFGIAYYLVIRADTANQLVTFSGEQTHSFFESIYFSFVSYTSLGYGDVVPVGPVQFMAGTQALVGLVFIAWTASFLYLEMQKHWEIR